VASTAASIVVSKEPSTAALQLATFYQLLNVDAAEPLYELVRAARADGQSLVHLLLSVIDRDGIALGSGARDELARACDRAAEYRMIHSAVHRVTDVRVVKGPSLGRHYPDGLLRPVGDLDLVVADEERLWQAVRAITETVAVEHIDVSLFGQQRRHIFAVLSWSAKDPLLDPECSVDISTAAFGGDLKAVGCRPELPDDPLIADLLSLAEERFQRPFTVKDIIDVLILSGLDFPPAKETMNAADALQLAPELRELLVTASEHVALGPLSDVIPLADDSAEREMARRSAAEAVGAMADDPPLHGFLLQRTPWRNDLERAVRHDFAGGTLLRVPVGDYLLTSREVVPRAQFHAAMAALSALGGSPAAADPEAG
jgi:hypothetical protein